MANTHAKAVGPEVVYEAPRRSWLSAVTQIPEETVNQWTHALGLLLSICAVVPMLNSASTCGDSLLNLGCWIYAFTLVGLFAASTLSHSFESAPHRDRFRTLDQVFIFAVMAGTFTPVGLVCCRDGWWRLTLITIWTLALTGILIKLRITRRENVPLWFYVLLGWIPAIAMTRMYASFGGDGVRWVIAGGISYSLGVLFLANDHRMRFFHGVWHILVIIGSACHYVVILHYALAT